MPESSTVPSHDDQPRYDAVRRELSYHGHVVKRFRRPFSHQEIILAAFEEEGWPPHIDDPLPPSDGIDAKQRLHDAVKRLNHQLQATPLLHFGGDGTGEGVVWELTPAGRRKKLPPKKDVP